MATSVLNGWYGNEGEELAVLESQWATFRLGYEYNRRVFKGRDDISSVQNDRMLSARVLMDIADIVEREGKNKTPDERREIAVDAFRDVISRLDTAELVADDIVDLDMGATFDAAVSEFDTRLESGYLLMSPYHSSMRCMGVYDEFDARFAALGQFVGEIGDPFFAGERTTRDFRTFAQPMFAVPVDANTSLSFILGRNVDDVAISEDVARRRPLYEYNPVLEDGHRLYDKVDSDFVQFETTRTDRDGNETVEDAMFSVDSVDKEGNQTKVRRSVNFSFERDLMSSSDFYRLRPYLHDNIAINPTAAERAGSSGSVPTKTGLLYAHFIEPYMDASSEIGRLATGDFSGDDEVSRHNAHSQRILKELLLSQVKTAADMADAYAALGMDVKVRPVMAKPGALELIVTDSVHSIAVRVTGALTAEEENGRLSVYAPKIDVMAHKGLGGRYANFSELDRATSAEEIGRTFDQTGVTSFRDRTVYRLGYTLSNGDDIDPMRDVSDDNHNRDMLPVLCNTEYLQENHGCGLLDESLNIYHLMLPSLGLLGVPALQLSNVLSGEDAPDHNDKLGPTTRGLVRSSKLLSSNTQANRLISTRVRQSRLPANDVFPSRYVDVISTHRKVLDAEQTVAFNRDAADEILVRAVDSARERAFELIGVDRLREAAYAAIGDMLERAVELADAGELSEGDAEFVRSLDVSGVWDLRETLDLERDNAEIARLYRLVDGKGVDGEPVGSADDGHEVSFELRDLRDGLWDTLIGRAQADADDLSVDERAQVFVDNYVGSYPGRDAFLYGRVVPADGEDDDFISPSSVLYASGHMVRGATAAQDFLRGHFDDVDYSGEDGRIDDWAEYVMVEGHMEDMRDLFDQYSPASDFVSEYGDVLKYSFNPAHVAMLSSDVSSERVLGDLMASAWLPDDVDMTLTEAPLARSLASSLWQRYEFDRLSGSLLGDYREAARVTERLRKFDSAHCVSNVELKQIDRSGQDLSDADVRSRLEAELLRDGRPSLADYSSGDVFRESLGLDTMSDNEAVRNMRAVINNVNQTLLSMGFHNGIDCRVSFNIDASGILQYSIAKINRNPPSKAPFAFGSNELLVGQVGPICVPDARGVVRFPNGRSYVPPMRGHVLPRSFEHPGGMASRMGVTTYQQSLMSAVSAAVRADIMNMSASTARVLRVGSAHSMNRFYGLQRADAEDVTSFLADGRDGVMSELNDARVRALASTVLLPKSYGDGGDRADLSAMSRRIDNGRMMDDSHGDTLRMLGRPCSVPSIGDAHYVDVTTWRDGPKQGQKMCLDERIAERMLAMSRSSARPTGRNINRSLLVEDAASGVELPNFATAPIRDFVAQHVNGYGEGEHDPMFRLMMANTNLMHCRDVLEDVGVAMMPFRGWCQDDGLVISSELAERVHLEDSVNGGVRGLRIGDKLSDCHGNKGTVACIIDRSWTEDQARERDLLDEWRVFADNGPLDIVVNPYSPVSRGNAGSIVEMVENGGYDLVLRDENGEAYMSDFGVGRATWLVHDKEVDQKTVIYDRENPGNHRNAGWQSNAAFIGDGVYHMLDDIYSRGGGRGLNILREASLMCGVNVDEHGYINKPKEGYDDAIMRRELVVPTRVVDGAPIELTDGESLRELLRAPIEANKGVNRFDKLGQVTRAVESGLSDDDPRINMLVEDVMMSIRRDGCAIDLPFALKLPDRIVDKLNEALPEPLAESACYATVDNGDSHRLGILSLSCQHGSDDDLMGSMLFKSDYANIVKCAIRYSLLEAAGGTLEPKQVDDDDEFGGMYDDDFDRGDASSELSKNMQWCCDSAQRSLNKIINTVYDKRLADPKWNCINRGMVRCPYPYLSATSVWTPDPRLALDEVRIGPEMAERLRVKDGEPLYIERSPVLQSSAHATLVARVDDGADVANRLYGVAINPLLCKLLSGDFDGDTVAVLSVPNMPKEVQDELRSRTNLETRILDFDHPASNEYGECVCETVTSHDGSHEWRVPKVGFSLGLKGADMAYVDKSFADEVETMRVELLRDLCEAADKQHEHEDITCDTMREAIVSDFDAVDDDGSAYAAAHKCMNQLSEKCASALESTTAVCAADLSDTKTFVEWLDRNVVEVGAKGNEGRLAELRDYMNADMSDAGERARRELRDAECDMAISTKSQVTGLAGTFMKNALAVAYNAMDKVREHAVRQAMVLSEGAYQATLDVKCDPSAAFRLQDMLFHAIDGELYRTRGKTVSDFARDMLDVFQRGGMGRCITRESADEFASLLPSPENGGSDGALRKVCGMRDKGSLSKGMALFEAGQTGFIDNMFVYWGSNVGGWVDGGLREVYGERHEFVSHVQDVERERVPQTKSERGRGRRNQTYGDQYTDDVYVSGSSDARYVYDEDSFDDVPDINYTADVDAKEETKPTSVRVYSPDDVVVDKGSDGPDV